MTHRPRATETTPAASVGSTAETVTEPATETRPAVPDVSVSRGGIGAVQAGEVVVSVGAIGAAQAERVSVELGAIGAVAAGRVRLSSGAANLVLAREARFEQAIVRSIFAQRVTLRRGSAAGIVLAARVDGPGRPLIDGRAGLVAGTIVALAWLIVRRLR
jgi:hypothetical protein